MAGHPSLLLLPALDVSTGPSSWNSSYKSTFASLLPKLLPQNNGIVAKLLPRDQTSITRLDVGLVLSSPYPASTTSRSTLFSPVQNTLKQAYSLITSVATSHNIDLDMPGGIDIRLFVLEPRADQLPQKLVGKLILSGPVVDFDTFILSDRAYSTIYTVEGETGEAQLKKFLTVWGSRLKEEPPPVVRLPSGPAIVNTAERQSSVPDGPVKEHSSVAVGGTFDHLHIGHKLLLTSTILAAQPSPSQTRLITVGITGDELLVNKKYGSQVESWTERQERCTEFVDSTLAFYPIKASPNVGINASGLRTTEYIDEPGPNGKVVRVTYKSPHASTEGGIVVNYTQISDPFGPTITDSDISAIVLSAETRAGGKAINDKRHQKGWGELEVFEVGILDASPGLEDGGDAVSGKESFESKISSTEIRRRLYEKTKTD